MALPPRVLYHHSVSSVYNDRKFYALLSYAFGFEIVCVFYSNTDEIKKNRTRNLYLELFEVKNIFIVEEFFLTEGCSARCSYMDL